MKNLTYPAKFIRLAMSCQANKDIRFYLNGILLESNGRVIGTDGHKIAMTKSDETFDAENVIVNIDGKIPLSADKVTFDFEKMQVTAIKETPKNGEKIVKILLFTIVEGNFPDWRRCIPDLKNDELQPIPHINASYLAAASIFADGKNYCGVEIIGHGSPVVGPSAYIRPTGSAWPNDTFIYVMGMRK